MAVPTLHPTPSIPARAIIVFLLLCFSIMVFALAHFPPFWWDEGWTSTVARNWVERGFYGLWLNGQPAAPSQSAAFPSVFSTALSFQLLGIGLWQSRLVSVLYMTAALAAQYGLTRRLYGARAGLLAILALVLLTPHFDMHPLYTGRTVLAEPIMLFLLIAGYICLWSALRGRRIKRFVAAVAAVVAWSLALDAKAQPLPFWSISLLAGILYCAYARRWREALLTAGIGAGALFLMRAWLVGVALYLGDRTLPSGMDEGLLNVTAVVPVWEVRLDAALTLLLTGLLFVIALVTATVAWAQGRADERLARRCLLVMLLAFTWSWTLWYLLLSVAFARYLMPAVFVGSAFTGWMLDRVLLQLPWGNAAQLRPSARRFGMAVGVIALAVLYLGLMLWQLAPHIRTDSSAVRTTAWLNENVPPDALVETYESEILFGLAARAHFPPGTVNVQAIQKREIDPNYEIAYDPRPLHPDYIVVGRFAQTSHLYDQLLDSGEYVPVTSIGAYTIYRLDAPLLRRR